MWSIQETTCPYKPVDSHQTEKLAISIDDLTESLTE